MTLKTLKGFLKNFSDYFMTNGDFSGIYNFGDARTFWSNK